jgi:hypothetical protein
MTSPADAWSDENGLRWYTFQGQDFLSVTSMRKVLGLPYPLHHWIINQTLDGILRDPGLVTRGVDMENEKQVKEARKVLRALGTVERDKAANRGTDVHAAIAAGASLGAVEPELRPYVEQYANAVITLGIQPLLVEKQVFSQSMGYAGSFDLVARLLKVPGRPVAVIDLKTGNAYTEHALQAYSYFKADFVAEGDVIDTVATALFKQADHVGILRIGADDWHYHDIRLDQRLHKAWHSMCLLSQWMLTHPSLTELEVLP